MFNALLTEHFVLQTARGITVAESSSRASLYFVTLSSALVAYGFLAGSSHETAYLAVVLPVLVLLGIASHARLVETSLEDVLALAGIQRIRGYYARLSEEAPRYFPLPSGAVAPNELLDTCRHAGWWGRVFYTMSTSVGVVNAVVAGTALFVLLSAGDTDDAGCSTHDSSRMDVACQRGAAYALDLFCERSSDLASPGLATIDGPGVQVDRDLRAW